MKIKLVVIDLELSARAKRIAAAVMVPALVIGAGAVASAKVTNVWNDGDVLKAADLNQNFHEFDMRLLTLEKGPPVLGVTSDTFQGSIGGVEDGPTNGYAVAQQKCASAFPQSPFAHMCTAEEIVHHRANGGAMPNATAWFAGGQRIDGSYSPQNDPWVVFSDCGGFSAAGSPHAGSIWNGSLSMLTWTSCDASYPILCCE